jgi:hypothetical protein
MRRREFFRRLYPAGRCAASPRFDAGLFSSDSQGRGSMRVLPARLMRCTLAQAGHRSEMYTLSSGTSSANQTCMFWPMVAQR